jgi:hypothetical protein
VALVSGSGCAVSRDGELTGNGRFWSAAGRLTDKVHLTEPYVDENAFLATTNSHAGAACVPCPNAEHAGTFSSQESPEQ